MGINLPPGKDKNLVKNVKVITFKTWRNGFTYPGYTRKNIEI